MNENRPHEIPKKEEPLLNMGQISTIPNKYKPNEKIQLFIMWQIYNKRYTIGSKLFYDEIHAKVGANKSAYAKARMFLEGAGLIVDEVIIADKLPNNLIERYGLIHDQTKSQN